MLKVGITGGIGSGKSTVSAVFVFLGVPYYNADERAKFLCDKDPVIQSQLIQAFGTNAYRNNRYNVEFFREIAFKDPSVLTQLNGIIHPRVAHDYESFCQLHADSHYTLKEAAILFESGSYTACDKTILVVAPQRLRIQRVMERDNVEEDTVLSRMSKQWSDEKKMALADFIIKNDGNTSIINQVLALHRHLMSSV